MKKKEDKNTTEKEESCEKTEKTLLEEKDEKILELISHIQRLQAEFENYKKRTEAEKINFQDYGKMMLAKKLLPILDNIELSLINTENKEEFEKGIKLVYSQFVQSLEDEKITPIPSKGQQFDPRLHEALLSEESKKKSGTILEELQKGYMLRDKIIRNTKVKVAR